MARLREMKTRRRYAKSKSKGSRKVLIAAYGLVVLLSIGVLGGYVVFGKSGAASPGTAVLALPRLLPPDLIAAPPSVADLPPAPAAPGIALPDWDLGKQGLGNIVLAPSSVSASDVTGQQEQDMTGEPDGPEGDAETAVLTDPSRSFLPAWRRYAVAPPLIDGRPMIAIVIDDVGEDPEILARLLAIDAPLTLSFFSWVDNVKQKTARARDAGFELMVHVPMEPVLPKDPGPQALLEGLGLSENRRRLVWHLDQFEGFVGFNNHMGSLVTADAEAMTMVMNVVREQGLLYVDSRTTPKSIAGSIARRTGLPAVDRDVFIDYQGNETAIKEQLDILERKALKYGRAVAIAHAVPLSIGMLEKWIPEARARGLVIVPVSTIVRAQMG